MAATGEHHQGTIKSRAGQRVLQFAVQLKLSVRFWIYFALRTVLIRPRIERLLPKMITALFPDSTHRSSPKIARSRYFGPLIISILLAGSGQALGDYDAIPISKTF